MIDEDLSQAGMNANLMERLAEGPCEDCDAAYARGRRDRDEEVRQVLAGRYRRAAADFRVADNAQDHALLGERRSEASEACRDLGIKPEELE